MSANENKYKNACIILSVVLVLLVCAILVSWLVDDKLTVDVSSDVTNQNDLINYRLKSLALTLISVVLDFHTHQPVLTSLCIPLFSTLRYTHIHKHTEHTYILTHTYISLFLTKKGSITDVTFHCFKFNPS